MIQHFPLSRRLALKSMLMSLACHRALAADGVVAISVFGDSQAQGLAGACQRMFRGDRSRRVLDHSKISTGLIPRANYNWPAQSHGVAAEHPAIAVAMFGANDRPPVHVSGHVDPTLLENFRASYTPRVTEIASAFRDASVPLVWVGHPIVRDAVFTEDMKILNDIFSDAVPAAGGTFVSTWDLFRGADGNFSAYGKGVDGQTTRLRADDGVHMTPSGYDVIANLLVPMLPH